jgi:hypothetical protein
MVDYEWNAKAGEEELLSWRIYPGRRVGLTFKPMPSITQSQLVDLLTRLSDINKTMGEQ